MTFKTPTALLLLPVVLAILFASLLWFGAADRRRRVFYAVVRALLLTLIVLALAEPRSVTDVEGRAVAFLVDVSRSVPGDRLAAIGRWIEQARSHRGDADDDCVILFGDDAAVERPFGAGEQTAEPDLVRPRARVAREASDIAAALRLAASSFPAGLSPRIVLITDGNENRGDAIGEARRLAASGVELKVLPIDYRRTMEVAVLRIDTPAVAPPGSVVTFTPILESTESGVPVHLRAFVNGTELASEDMVLPAGKARGPSFRTYFDAPGMHEVTVLVEGKDDTILRNNEARAGIRVLGASGVLVVEGGGGASPVNESLRAMGVATVRLDPAALGSSPLFYQPFDAVVLSDVSALDLTGAQVDSLESAVRDLGVGCLVLGGENAYATGGYRDTGIERLLPLNMEVKQKQVLLNGALVLILHTCEFTDGNYWAKKIAEDSILALTPKDWAGLIIYGAGGDSWLLDLQPVVDPVALAGKIESFNPGDMPSFDTSLKMASKALADCPAHLKHIVVISDGDAAQPDPVLINTITEQQITVSAVCVAPHGDNGAKTMAALSRWGRGRFYLLKEGDVGALPRIFVKEATTLRRNSVHRTPFTPEFTLSPGDLPPMLRGFGADLPSLGAYSITEGKDRAEVPIVTPDGDPVFATWRYGLGETAAFTSAMRGGWIGAWSEWSDLDRFFAQVVRGLFRRAERSGFHALAETRGGVATVRMTALSDAGEHLDFLEVEGTVTRPGEEPRQFPVIQRGAGVYEGTFPVRGDGTWVAVLRYDDPATKQPFQLEVPVAVSYPEEYAALETDRAFLARLESEVGAVMLRGDEDVFAGEKGAGRTDRPLAPALLIAAALLLPFDVAFRRLRVDALAALKHVVPHFASARRPKSKPVAASDAPEPGELGLPPAPEPAAPPATPSGGSAAGEEESADRMKGLLEAKKRARRKGRWEETGQ